ncbi:MAG TPA: cupin domain-containing protein, partial [Polyangiaceae bacterium]
MEEREMEQAGSKQKALWKAGEIRDQAHAYQQRLNPTSSFLGTGLSRLAGMERTNVSLARIPPGKDSFAYHAHLLDEEWCYIVSGRGVAEIDGAEHEVGPGDFMGFAAPQVPHLLENRGTEDLVYLMGGESHPVDVVEYP